MAKDCCSTDDEQLPKKSSKTEIEATAVPFGKTQEHNDEDGHDHKGEKHSEDDGHDHEEGEEHSEDDGHDHGGEESAGWKSHWKIGRAHV